MRLTHLTKEVHNNMTLYESGITADSSLDLQLRLTGGMEKDIKIPLLENQNTNNKN